MKLCFRNNKSLVIFVLFLIFVNSSIAIANKEILSPANNVKKYIYNLAEEMMNKNNKKSLIKNYVKKENLKRANQIKSRQNNLSKIINPFEVWSFCINSNYEETSMKKCNQIYGINNLEKLINCKNSFCNVCCDHFPNILNELIVDEKLIFQIEKNELKKLGNIEEINKCRKMCKQIYPIKQQTINPAPPRDLNLGKFYNNAALSCTDIQKWGDPQAKSGEYWIDLNHKGKVIAYCDMEIDKGGWTLFFNYFNNPNDNIKTLINSSKLPKNLSENSHVNLVDVGFEINRVKEIRFFCKEENHKNYYMHFKTQNQDIIKLAMTGDQNNLNFSSFQIIDLPYSELNNSERIFNKEKIEEIDYLGSDHNGGFWNTFFGFDNKFWTVKQGRFECGANHREELNNAENINVTHHQIWFRVAPSSDEYARKRYEDRNNK